MAKCWLTGSCSGCYSHIHCCSFSSATMKTYLQRSICCVRVFSPCTSVSLYSFPQNHKVTKSKSLNGALQTEHLLSLGPWFKQQSTAQKTFWTGNNRGRLRTSHSRGIRSSAEIYSVGVDSLLQTGCTWQAATSGRKNKQRRRNRERERESLSFFSHMHTHIILWCGLRLCSQL